jgi:hypothetical protein
VHFKVQGWEESWIDATHKIIHDEFDCSYASACPNLSGDTDDNDDYIAVGSVNLVSHLFFSGVLDLLLLSLLRPQVTCLTIYLTLLQSHWTIAMSSNAIFPWTQRMSGMVFFGGMTGMLPSLIYPTWPWIIYQFLVSVHLFYIS